jgi:hypothetical protein
MARNDTTRNQGTAAEGAASSRDLLPLSAANERLDFVPDAVPRKALRGSISDGSTEAMGVAQQRDETAMTISFTIPGKVAPKERPRFAATKSGVRVHTAKKTTNYEKN